MKGIFAASFLSIVSIIFVGCGETNTANTTTDKNAANQTNQSSAAAATPSPAEIAGGASIYKEHCAKCHKEDGSGGKVDVDGVTINAENFVSEKMKKMDDAKYYKYIAKGIPDEGMPAFEDKLTEAQIKDVVKYIRTEFQN